MIQLRVHACLQVYMGVTLDGPERVSLGWTASLRPYRTHPCYSVATDFSLYPARVTIATVVNRRQYYAHRSQSNLTTVAPKVQPLLLAVCSCWVILKFSQMNPHYTERPVSMLAAFRSSSVSLWPVNYPNPRTSHTCFSLAADTGAMGLVSMWDG